MPAFSPIENVIEAVRSGQMILLCDDGAMENIGDVILPAELVTADSVNFMAKHCRGLISLALGSEICERLDLPLMSNRCDSQRCQAFTVSIEAREGVSTGISAADRARTILTTVMPNTKAEDLVRPGHVEGATDIMRLAGFKPAAVICTVLDDGGMAAKMPYLEKFATQYNMMIATVANVISFRLRWEPLAERGVETSLLTPHGEFKAVCFTNSINKKTHLALIKGELSSDKEIMVRVHRECLTGDVFSSRHCKCGEQLERAMAMISNEGLGVILYLRYEGEPVCLCSRLTSIRSGNKGIDSYQLNAETTVDVPLKDYGFGAQMLVSLGVRKVRAITDNPRKIVALEGYNLEIVETVALERA